MLDERTVSRHHALLTVRGGAWYVEGLDSHNRLFVNGRGIGESALSHGDRIQMGSVLLEFLDGDEAKVSAAREPSRLDITQTPRTENLRAAYTDLLPGMSAVDRRLSHLLSLARTAALAQGVADFFEELVGGLKPAMDADRVVPVLTEPGEPPRHYNAEQHEFAEDPASLGLDPEILRRATIEGLTATLRHGERTVAVACAPIRIGLRNLGLIYCERKERRRAFSEDDLRYLVSVAAQTGVGIETVRVRRRMALRNRSLSRQLSQGYELIGRSPAMKELMRLVYKVAPTDAGILICGESGTGKEVIARLIHYLSGRNDAPLEAVNCAAVPPALMESELFGHVRGAFTGAVTDKAGRFELADSGTLFLDEIAEMPPQCQAKLLRVIEEGTMRKLGAEKDQRVSVRLIAATNRDPDRAVAAGRLRQDLFYRLDRLRILVPPLRERTGDVRPLVRHFVRRVCQQCKRPVPSVAADVLAAFESYNWPGNVRELRNVIERMVIMGEGPVLDLDTVPDDLRAAAAQRSARMSLREAEARHIARVLARTGRNKKKAAELLGIDRSTLYAKIRRYGMQV
jgi:DNA-binding NtrC family response regulator